MQFSFKQTLFMMEPKNKNCIDCGDENVDYVSVNNGVTLCEGCAMAHKTLGNQISYIKKMDENFDEYLTNFFVFGGNKKFKKKLKNLGVNLDMKRLKLYKTFGADYYRRCLKCKVKEEEKPEPDFEDPNEIIYIDSCVFPEFENYKINQIKKIDNKKTESHVIDNFDTNFKNLNINKITNESNANEIKENNFENAGIENTNKEKSHKGLLRTSVHAIRSVGGFIKKESVKGYKVIKKAGKAIAHKSKPATNIIKSIVGDKLPIFHKSHHDKDSSKKDEEKIKEINKKNENNVHEKIGQDEDNNNNDNQLDFE